MPRVIHFEIVADKPERAMKFYKEVFGWEFKNGMALKNTACKNGEDSTRITARLKMNQGSGR